MNNIILASSSKYRLQLIEKLGINAKGIAPNIDESAIEGESAEALAARLSLSKALAISSPTPDGFVIGSDQVATVGGRLLGKPGTHEAAAQQLRDSSGNTVEFYTGISLVRKEPQLIDTRCHKTRVHFRQLSERQIQRYIELEQPFDCAGSFKSEGLGICLFTAIEGDDPNALIGLPLILLTTMLAEAGIELPL